ncbi:hypothetical protein [Clostridium sp. UBA5988]|uniref:hypothetical protein n=1 Tax=Clostridium sp. UBA5988 TaxID=1946369 RepID=UPI003217E242
MELNEQIKQIKILKTIDEYIAEMSKWNPVHNKQKEFIETLVKHIYENNDNNIEVVPARCGMGKSTAINSILYRLVNGIFGETTTPINGYGAILVTDSLERLEKTYEYKKLKNFTYLMKYNNDIIEAENRNDFREQVKEQFKYPIILLTTQKYFKMTKEERNILYKWYGGARELCLMDEKPYLTKTIEINERYLADISVSLDEIKKCDDKVYILKTWKSIYNNLDVIREAMADKYTTMWLKKSKKCLLFSEDEDKKFFDLLSKYVKSCVYDDVLRLKDIYTQGCLFIASNNIDADNSRKFILLYNNMDKFDVDKCKYYILDATAKFDIDYKIDKRIKYMAIDDKKEDKDIRVNMIPFSTSQKKLKETGEYSNTNVIANWINKNFTDVLVACNRGSNGVIYNKLNKLLKTNNIEYFGNIKGKNSYESLNEMVHIGFNRFSDVTYLESYIILYDMASKFNKSANEDILEEINTLLKTEKGQFIDLKMKTVFVSKCVVDTVQNVMRIKCRHFTNTDKCNIWIITSKYYEDIVLRVADNIGADFKTFLPKEFEDVKVMSRKPMEGKEMTNPQKVMKYLNELAKGTIIKTKDIYSKTGLTVKELNKAKSNENVSKWFKEHTIKRGQYIA